MIFVIDASVALSWCFPNEHTVQLLDILKIAKRSEFRVPSIWPIEVANVLHLNLRKRRLNEAGAEQALSLLEALQIRVSSARSLFDVRNILRSSRNANLTAYDVEYLQLASDGHIPLATLDQELRLAALNAGVSVLL